MLRMCWVDCQESLHQISPPKKEQPAIAEPGISNSSERGTWGVGAAGAWGVDAWWSPWSPGLPCLLSKREQALQMGSASLGPSPAEDAGGDVPVTCQEPGGISLRMEVLTFAEH